MITDRLESLENRYQELEDALTDAEVIRDQELYQKYRKEHAELAPLVQAFRRYQQVQKDLADSQGLLKEETDEEMKAMAREEIETLKEQAASLEEELRFLLLPKDPNDEKNVILEIRAGTGGEEAGLFAADLFRMYTRLAERKGWKLEILSHSTTGIGGLKEIIASISGERVYSQLKYESGVHRVQRVPVTEVPGAHPHLGGHRGRPARGRRGGRADQPRRAAHRRLPLLRPRRPERQHHRLGGADHPSAHRPGGLLPGRKIPAQKQGQGPEGAAVPPARPEAA